MTHDKNLDQEARFNPKIKCSELLQNKQVRIPHHQKPNSLRMGSNEHWMSEISRSVQFAKQGKKLSIVQSIHADVARYGLTRGR
jgi:fructose-1,6-bisphosphatase